MRPALLFPKHFLCRSHDFARIGANEQSVRLALALRRNYRRENYNIGLFVARQAVLPFARKKH
jgi:hypothetical protein